VDFAQLGEIFLTSATLKFENDLYVISLNWFVIATGFVQTQTCTSWYGKYPIIYKVLYARWCRISSISSIWTATHQVYHYCIGCKTETWSDTENNKKIKEKVASDSSNWNVSLEIVWFLGCLKQINWENMLVGLTCKNHHISFRPKSIHFKKNSR